MHSAALVELAKFRDTCKPGERKTYDLRYSFNLKHREIGELLNNKSGSISSALSRIKKKAINLVKKKLRIL